MSWCGVVRKLVDFARVFAVSCDSMEKHKGFARVKSAKLAAFIAGCLLSAAPVFATSAYLADSDGDFGTVDLSTGVFTRITTSAPSDIYGMGFNSTGVLYGTNSANQANVYLINPLSGVATNLGSSGVYSAYGSTVGPDGMIYALSADKFSAFYTVNPSTLATNTISPQLQFSSDGLAVFIGGQFFTDAYRGLGDDQLVQVDTSTGAFTPIGGGLGANIISGTLVGNTVYGVGLSDGVSFLETIDTTTGSGTFVADITGLGEDADALGIAYFNPVITNTPEPATAFLLTLCVPVLVLIYRRKRAKAVSAAA